MKQALFATLIIIPVAILGAGILRNKTNELPSFTLEENNHISVVGEFNEKMQSDFTRAIINSSDEEVTVYINSPGGSVDALIKMVNQMKISGKKFKCIAHFAASAGFMLLQHCSTRLITSDGVIMSHNASVGLKGDVPKVKGILDYIIHELDTLDLYISSRMGYSLREYRALIANELWMEQNGAAEHRAIDGVVAGVTCSKALLNADKCPIVFSKKEEEQYAAQEQMGEILRRIFGN